MKNLNLIKKIANAYYVTTGLEFDDLMQEAALAYLKALKTYDPKKGSVSNWAWWCMSNHLKNYIKENRDKNITLFSFEEIRYDKKYDPVFFFETLSRDAFTVAETIIKAKNKYCAMDPVTAKSTIAKTMQKKGWDIDKILQAFKDLQLAFS